MLKLLSKTIYCFIGINIILFSNSTISYSAIGCGVNGSSTANCEPQGEIWDSTLCKCVPIPSNYKKAQQERGCVESECPACTQGTGVGATSSTTGQAICRKGNCYCPPVDSNYQKGEQKRGCVASECPVCEQGTGVGATLSTTGQAVCYKGSCHCPPYSTQ